MTFDISGDQIIKAIRDESIEDFNPKFRNKLVGAFEYSMCNEDMDLKKLIKLRKKLDAQIKMRS